MNAEQEQEAEGKHKQKPEAKAKASVAYRHSISYSGGSPPEVPLGKTIQHLKVNQRLPLE